MVVMVASGPGGAPVGAQAPAQPAPGPPSTPAPVPTPAPPPAAGAQLPPPFAFREAEATIAPSGTRNLRLLNNTSSLRTVEVAVSPAAFAVQAPGDQIGPGSTLDLVVTAADAAPGTQATVVVTIPPAAFVGPDSVALEVRATLTVVAPTPSAAAGAADADADAEAEAAAGDGGRAGTEAGAEAGAARPLVDEVSVTSYRFVPWGDAGGDVVVPLAGPGCDDASLPEGTAGGVTGASGTARVEASCDAGDEGAAGVRLDLRGLGAIGRYHGDIDLTPDAGGGTVSLSVRRTDHVLAPLLVLLAGVGIGWVILRRLGLLRAGLAADRRAWLALARIDAAHRTFRGQAGDHPWATYSFAADGEARVRDALGLLGAARRAGRRRSGRVTRAVESLEVVDRATRGWELLAGRLAELDEAVTGVALGAPAHRPSEGTASEPACLAPARLLLTGRALDTSEAVEQARAVDAAATLCQGWLGWARSIASVESGADLAALEVDDLPAHHPDVRTLAEARSHLAGAKAALWEVESLDDLHERGLLTAVDKARAMIDGMSRRPGDAEADQPLPAPGTSPLRAALDEAPAPAGPADDAGVVGTAALPGRAWQAGGPRGDGAPALAAGRRRWRAVIVAGLSAVVVAWSGLTYLYSGRAFGTTADYLSVFLWGTVAQVVVVSVAIVLDRLTVAPLPARRRSRRA